MYVQCKMYVQLFKKWKQFNRVIYIKNASDDEVIQIETDDACSSRNACDPPYPVTVHHKPPDAPHGEEKNSV